MLFDRGGPPLVAPLASYNAVQLLAVVQLHGLGFLLQPLIPIKLTQVSQVRLWDVHKFHMVSTGHGWLISTVTLVVFPLWFMYMFENQRNTNDTVPFQSINCYLFYRTPDQGHKCVINIYYNKCFASKSLCNCCMQDSLFFFGSSQRESLTSVLWEQ